MKCDQPVKELTAVSLRASSEHKQRHVLPTHACFVLWSPACFYNQKDFNLLQVALSLLHNPESNTMHLSSRTHVNTTSGPHTIILLIQFGKTA